MADCMLCDADPCECNRPKRTRKAAVARPPKLTPPPVLAVSANVSLPSFAPPPPASPQIGALVSQQSDADAEVAAALRALAPIMSFEARAEFALILGVPPTRLEKIHAWQNLSAYRRSQR